MYSGELEVQAKRKSIAVLHHEMSKILSSARVADKCQEASDSITILALSM
jgi:HJR/Mrr/RecB family endonuclease